jgi:hypothetical protein
VQTSPQVIEMGMQDFGHVAVVIVTLAQLWCDKILLFYLLGNRFLPVLACVHGVLMEVHRAPADGARNSRIARSVKVADLLFRSAVRCLVVQMFAELCCGAFSQCCTVFVSAPSSHLHRMARAMRSSPESL